MPELPPQHIARPYEQPSRQAAYRAQLLMPDGATIAAWVFELPKDSPVKTNSATVPGAPILMLHGNGEEHGIFGPLIDAAVACGRRVIAIDSRAQGLSTRGSAALSYELMANDVLHVLEALHIDQVHVLGFSDGAIEGLLLARDHAKYVYSLTAIGANLSPEGLVGTDEIEQAARANTAWAKRKEEGPAHYPDGSCAPSRKQAAINAELLHLMVVEPHIAATSLSAIACPTTIIAGALDDIPLAQTDQIASAIVGAREVIVADADHNLPKVAPEAILRELLVTIATAEATAPFCPSSPQDI